MLPGELRDELRQRPVEPFRLVPTEGGGHDVRHPDLPWAARRTAHVGLTGQRGQTLFEGAARVDLLHAIRTMPLDAARARPTDGTSDT